MRFPILQDYDYRRDCYKHPHLPEYPQSVPWDLVKAHEAQIVSNHDGQSLECLAQRGGLTPIEIVMAIEDSNPARPTGAISYTMMGAIHELERHVRKLKV